MVQDQVLEQDEVHGDEDRHMMMVIKALNLEKKKEKNKSKCQIVLFRQ
jgi:hypothetical protein